MSEQSATRNPRSVIIVGAGPAGASLAIRLAEAGHAVTLLEKEHFPREKLCGEFISPECFRHFAELGVSEAMLSLGGARLTETHFFDPAGRSVTVPTRWFGHGDFALSLSRAQMDLALLDRAKAVGVVVLEGMRAVAAISKDGRVESVTVKNAAGEPFELAADLFIDATGRATALKRLTEKGEPATPRRSRLVAFKNHLLNVNSAGDACEIYVFTGGYGGLSPIEDGKANLCFIVRADVAKEFIGKTNNHIEFIASRNRRAADTLFGAVDTGDWLAVPIGDFGPRKPSGPSNLLAIGDAAAFIDPFTGSGMLMALESADLLAKCTREAGPDTARLRKLYEHHHAMKFRNRLAASAVLRRAAFIPKLATVAIVGAGLSDRLRERLARATRSDSRAVRGEG